MQRILNRRGCKGRRNGSRDVSKDLDVFYFSSESRKSVTPPPQTMKHRKTTVLANIPNFVFPTTTLLLLTDNSIVSYKVVELE